MRRLDARRAAGARPGRWLEQLRVSRAKWPVLVALAFFAGATTLVLSGEEVLPWALNQSVDQPITARVDFDRINQTKTAQAQEAARRAVPNYYRLNRPLLEQIGGDLREMFAACRAADSFEKFTEDSRGRWTLEQSGFELLKRISDDAEAASPDEWLGQLLERLRQENLVQRPTAAERDPLTQGADEAVLDRDDGALETVSRQRLSYVTNEQHVVRLAKELAEIFPRVLRPAVADVIVRNIRVEPEKDRCQGVFVFDRERTGEALERVRQLPPVSDHYKRGDVLVPPGTITAELYELLAREHDAYLQARRTSEPLYRTWVRKRIGQTGIVFLATLGLALYTSRFQPKIVQNPVRALGLAVLLLIMLLISRLMLIGHWSEVWTLAPTLTAAAILTIAYSPRFALGVAGVLAVLTTLALNASFSVFLIQLTVATVIVFSLGDIRSRIKLIEVGLLTAAAAGVSTLLVGLTNQQALLFVLSEAGIASVAAILSCGVVLVLLPVIEKLFRIATSMTLLEWADTSTPLLKQLIQKAPGTWQHSHLIGSMAEAAADEIGANGLLVRVGAYYHDIGKMCKPAYFVENQQAQISAHSRLAPRMSLLVILGHVKDGLALAREHGLPPILHQFIAEHHGTTVVRYFHAMAAQDQLTRGRNGNDREIDEAEFRYPGPRPASKESAILMLCDAVEGTVRSLTEPTPGRIENIVHEVAMQRLMDGQLDDCDITLKELSRIEASLVKSLCSIYHGRIAYPKSAAPVPEMAQSRSA